MSDLVPLRRAMLSVSDKTGLAELARDLAERGVEIVSTGGTAAALAEAGIEVITVESLTGVAEMMGGRVKTLHPAVHGAVLARRGVEEDEQALRDHDIKPIDLVCVNLYPFERTAARPGVTPAEAVEQIDIGGPALVRAAAKNHESVAVVTSPDQYGELRREIETHGGATTLALRRRLAAEAFALTGAYDRAIAAWLSGDGGGPPATRTLVLADGRELRYGENPHQSATLYATSGGPGGLARSRTLAGKPLSYNNILDASAALELVLELCGLDPRKRPCCAIVKHTNPCGAAFGATLADAFDLAYDGDPLAAYGGILAVSVPVDEPTAARIVEGSKFLEVIVAPGFEPRAAQMLSERFKNLRLVSPGPATDADPREQSFRSVPGGMLVQDRDLAAAEPQRWRHVAGPAPSPDQLADGALAWTLAKHLKSNAVAIAAGGRMIGGGCGQVDRVTACRLAVEKSAGRIDEHAVAASDAFFPFPDGPRILMDAGVRCIVHPGGSRRDDETVAACADAGVTCMVTGVRHFRH